MDRNNNPVGTTGPGDINKDYWIEQARQKSIEDGCTVHLNYSMQRGYYLDDWYNCDSTIASFTSGLDQ